MTKGMSDGWSGQWPREPGAYWMYGFIFDGKYPRMEVCRVRKVSNGTVMALMGAITSRKDHGEVYFKLIPEPEPPFDMQEKIID